MRPLVELEQQAEEEEEEGNGIVNICSIALLVRAYISKSVVLGSNPDLGNLCTLMYML
jgi:hypothetical protein